LRRHAPYSSHLTRSRGRLKLFQRQKENDARLKGDVPNRESHRDKFDMPSVWQTALGERPLRATSGHTQPDGIAMSAIVGRTDSSQRLRHVRDVPFTEVRPRATLRTLGPLRLGRLKARRDWRAPKCQCRWPIRYMPPPITRTVGTGMFSR
jgi:hypothetical protein